MSTLSGIGTKGEKPKGKFTSFNINNIYKGTSAAPQRSPVSRSGHGLQSLGKVPSARRMPPPAHLPSLKKEYKGNDPAVNLVPTGGAAGWGNGKEEKNGATLGGSTGTPQTPPVPPPAAPHQSPAPPPQQSSPAAVSVEKSLGQSTPTPAAVAPATPSSSTQKGPSTISSQGQKQSGATPQASGNNNNNSSSNNNSNNSTGGKSWSSVTGGNKKQGGFLDQKSPFFQEEFPKLASGGEEKSSGPRKEDEHKELPYGPGPSLRPQNVLSWREGGGGRGSSQQQSQADQDQSQPGSQMSGGGEDGDSKGADAPDSPSSRPPQMHPQMGPGGQRPPHPMGMPMMPPQYRNMMPPYMYRFPHMPPNYPHGMPRPPFMEQRFRGPPPPQRQLEGGERFQRPSIIKDEALRELDNIGPNDGGWAAAQLEMDFSEKLRFSDDEDGGGQPGKRDSKTRNRDKNDGDREPFDADRDHSGPEREHMEWGDRVERERAASEKEQRSSRDQPKDVEDWDTRTEREKDRPPFDRQRMEGPGQGPREAWAAAGPMPPYGRPPMDQRQWQQRMSFDHRGGPVGFPVQPQFRGAPPMNQRPPFPPPSSTSPRSAPAEGEEDEILLQQRRQQKQEDLSAAVLRARQRREEEERRMEEQRRAGANERLRQLDEKAAKKDKDKDGDRASSASESEHRSRTTSESSDKDRHRERENKPQQKNQKNLPPRLQKSSTSPQSSQSGSVPRPPTPQGSQGSGIRPPPPQGWPGYADPRWSSMPPHFMDPRMGGRSPMDMPPGWEEQMRRGPMPHPYYGFPPDYEKADMEQREYDQRFAERKERDRRSEGSDGAREKTHRESPREKDLVRSDSRSTGDDSAFETPDVGQKLEDKIAARSPRADSFSEEHMKPKSSTDPESQDWAQIMESSWDREVELEQQRENERKLKDEKAQEDKRKRAESKSQDKEQSQQSKENKVQDRAKGQDRVHDKDKTKGDRGDKSRKDRDRNRRNHDGGSSQQDQWESHYQAVPPRQKAGMQQDKRRNEWGAPPPIPLQQSQQNMPHRSNYTSLKRSHSTLSNTSSQNDRKADVKEDAQTGTPPAPQKAPSRESLKDLKPSSRQETPESIPEQKKDEDSRLVQSEDPKKSSKPKFLDKVKDQPEASEVKRDDLQEKPSERKDGKDNQRRDKRPPKSKGDKRQDDRRQEDRRQDDRRQEDRRQDERRQDDRRQDDRRQDDRRQDERRLDDRPPAKKMRDEYRQDGYGADRERSRSGRGRASSREFIRGGRNSRGRSGYSNARAGRGRGPRTGHQDGYEVYDSYSQQPGFDMTGGTGNLKQYSNVLQKGMLSKDDRYPPVDDSLLSEDAFVDAQRPPPSDSSKQLVEPEPPSLLSDNLDSKDLSATPDESKMDPQVIAKDTSGGEVKKGRDRPPRERRDRNRDGDRNREGEGGRGGSKSGDRRRRDQNRRDGTRGEGRRDRGEDGGRKDGRPRRDRDGHRDDGRKDREDGRRDRGEPRRDREDRQGPMTEEGMYWNKAASNGNQGRSSSTAGYSSRRGNRSDGRAGRGGPNSRYMSAPPRASGGLGRPPSKASSSDGKGMDSGSDNPDRSPKNGHGVRHTAPRFSHSAGPPTRGRGYSERGGFGGRGRGARGGSASAARQTKKTPQLAKQNSSDLGNEEWETASESSDVFERRDFKSEANKENKDKKDVKKSFSNQRPSTDRQNRRNTSSDNRKSSTGGNSNHSGAGNTASESPASGRGSVKEKSPPSARPNGSAPSASRGGNGGRGQRNDTNPNRREIDVYRVDKVVPNDPSAIQNAINNINNTKNKSSRKSDLTDVSKPLKTEKEKKDALANIDINNYASVVVIDNQPEVTIDDPAYLFESNEGFQEVTSKKKQKQKAAQEEIQKKPAMDMVALTQAQHKKKDDGKKDKSSSKSRSTVSAESKRRSKLPPRLAKQREQKEKEKQQQRGQPQPGEQLQAIGPQDILPKIENWDNEMANNIPSSVTSGAHSKEQSPPQDDAVRTSSTLSGPFSMPLPAPKPAVNAWEKPISMMSNSSPSVQVVASAAGKFPDKGDQPDSGIDISEPLNSATSSTRSSPSAESKHKHDEMLTKIREPEIHPESKSPFEAPKPQRQPKSGRIGEKNTEAPNKIRQEDAQGNKVVKKPDVVPPKPAKTPTSQPQAIDAIQLPASFKDPFKFSKDEATSGFSFTFDANLGLSEEKVAKNLEEASKGLNTQTVMQSPTSPATDDLGQKIAKAKNVWENFQPDSVLYEHAPAGHIASSGGQLSSNSATVSVSAGDVISDSTSSAFSSFGPAMEANTPAPAHHLQSKDSQSEISLTAHKELSTDDSNLAAINVSVSQVLSSYAQDSSLVPTPAVAGPALTDAKTVDLIESSNVCKVKPQQQHQQQAGGVSPGMTGLPGVPSNPSPPPGPVIIAQISQYHPFPLGSSQLVGQDTRYNQPTYGFSLSQPQQPQPPQPPQPQAPMAQPAYSQPNLFLQATPGGATGMTQNDLYQSNNQLSQQFRSQFGQSQQQSTIMVSSTTSSLMSTTIKPPNTQNQYMSNSQGKSSGLAPLPYGQLVGLTGSPMYVQYDPGQPVNTNQAAPAPAPAAAAPAPPPQNVNSSQIIGSHIVGQRTAMQPVQNQSSFYTQQPLQQTGFYQAQQGSSSMSNLQGALQQVGTGHSQFSIPGFNAQPQNLNLPVQTVSLTGQSQLNKSAAPFKPAAQQQQPSSNQVNTQVKSPPHSGTPNSSFPGAVSAFNIGTNTFQQYNTNKLQQLGQQQYSQPTSNTPSYDSTSNMMGQQGAGSNNAPGSSITQQQPLMPQQYQPQPQQQQQMTFQQPQQQQQQQQQQMRDQRPIGQRSQAGNTGGMGGSMNSSNQQFQQKMNSPFVGQPMQPTAPLMRAQLMMAMRGPPPSGSSSGGSGMSSGNRFGNPHQQQQQQQQPNQQHQQQQQVPSAPPKQPQQHSMPVSSSRQNRPNVSHPSSAGNSAGSNQKLKDLQAKQRQELLQHAASFLNQQAMSGSTKTPKPTASGKGTEKAENSTSSPPPADQDKEDGSTDKK